jgi:hypothetical protein
MTVAPGVGGVRIALADASEQDPRSMCPEPRPVSAVAASLSGPADEV